jgi:hypothetical protein
MILLVESIHRDISWKEPRDLSYKEAASGVDQKSGPGLCSNHVVGDDFFHHARRGAHVAFADGTVHFLPEDIPLEDLQALLTGDSAYPMNLESLERPNLHWFNIFPLSVLIVFSLVLIIDARLHQWKQVNEQKKTPQNGNQGVVKN